MKNWNLFSFTKVFLAAFFVLAVFNSFAIVIRDDMVIQSIKSLSIPIFLIFFYVKYNRINMLLMVFLALAFFSDCAGILFHDLNVLCIESICYSFAFMQLIVLMLPKFKFIQFDGLIKAYLFMMLLVTLFFIKILYDFVGFGFLNSTEVMMFFIKCLVVIAMVFVAYGAYLHVQCKQSILFLIATVCFGFSCVLDYLNFSFVNISSFMVLNRITYLLGVFFIFKFIIEVNKSESNYREADVNENFSKDNLLV